MKQLFYLFSLLMFVCISCSKDKTETPQPADAILLQKHDWEYDSGYSIEPDGKKYPNTILQSIGETVSFSRNTYTLTFHNPYNVVQRNYQVEDPNIIYFWSQGSAMSKDTFATIETVTDKTLVIYEANTSPSGGADRNFYHAK